jgi:hypothetical protein
MVSEKNGANAATHRPTEYTAEIGLEICGRLVGGEGLRAICADPAMPDRATVQRWLACHKEFCHRYASAREEQADDLYGETIEIADDRAGDWVEKVRASGRVVIAFDDKHMARCRLRIKVRQWVADRLEPQRNDGRPRHSTIWSYLK